MEQNTFELALPFLICKGLDRAMDDFAAVSRLGTHDVVPKEDQLKCGIYSAATAAGYLVHVEGARARNAGRLDLKIIDRGAGKSAAIEIKMARCGNTADRWNNSGQQPAWIRDLEKLQALEDSTLAARYFVLGFAYQSDFDAVVRRKIEEFGKMPAVTSFKSCSRPVTISTVSGLDHIEYFLFSVAPKPPSIPAAQ